jgi:hypothetical protein
MKDMKESILHCQLVAIGLLFSLILANSALASSNNDDFNDNSKAAAKWGSDRTRGHGVLTESHQRLEYTCNEGTVEDSSDRPWMLTRFPTDKDWEIQVDVSNSTAPSAFYQVNSFGVDLLGPRSGQDVYGELYRSALGGLPARTGFASDLQTDGNTVASVDLGTEVANAAVRMSFNSTTKVLSMFYDADVSDDYQWTQYGSFGLAGSGGANGNTDWTLTSADQFSAFVYGYSVGMTINSGEMYGDNFRETGGVTPSGAPTPDPVGSFPFSFPKNNPLLTRIINISGNYHGSTHTSSNRVFNVAVAQDESGKITAMGTLDGVRDKSGNSELSGSVGSVSTVKGEPSAQLKGSFSGTRDGQTATGSANATGPIEIVDIGGGTNGVTGTASYRGKIAGVPFAGKNIPLQVPAPDDAIENIRQDWRLQLDLNRKIVKGKERTVASAKLQLPNGDTLSYPEKSVRYSTKSGYNLSFQSGTNVTANPRRIDRKSSILIKGLTFEEKDGGWQPTGGTINYKFLGQKGTARLMEFVEH